MTREIKFRGKARVTGEWFYGNLYDKDTHGRTHIKNSRKGCLDIDPSTVGQYTGIKDKEWREIYEGDIVEYYDDIEDELLKGFIRYEVDVCSFCIIPINPAEKFGLTAYWSVKVIGNKFDNPELIERKEQRYGEAERDRNKMEMPPLPGKTKEINKKSCLLQQIMILSAGRR